MKYSLVMNRKAYRFATITFALQNDWNDEAIKAVSVYELVNTMPSVSPENDFWFSCGRETIAKHKKISAIHPHYSVTSTVKRLGRCFYDPHPSVSPWRSKKTYFPAINFDQFCTLPLTKKNSGNFFKLDDKHANYLRFPDATMGGITLSACVYA